MTMRRITLAFQNLSGNGTPPLGQFVGICETNRPAVAQRLGRNGHTVVPGPAEGNPEVQAAYLDIFDRGAEVKVEVLRLHRSGRAFGLVNFGPTRVVLTVKGQIEGVKVAFLVTHFVNSAWAPKHKPTTFRRLRRRLWLKAYKIVSHKVLGLQGRGFVVVLMGDFNRLGRWSFPAMASVVVGARPGLDRLFVSADSRIRVRDTWEGPHTGRARVTHGSINAVLEIGQP